MARQRTVDYTALDLNIYQENVSTETYIKLFEGLQNNHREIPLKRDNYLHLFSLKPINPDAPINGFKGVIFKRNGLPKDWYNVLEEKRSLNTDMEKEFIPEAWKANVRFFDFTFYPLQKKIVCEIKHKSNVISQNVIESFFKYLLGTEDLGKIFNRIEVNLVKEKLTAEKIISTSQINYLEMVVSESPEIINSESSKLEKEIFNEMNDFNIQKYIKILIADKAKFLKLSQKHKELITFAVRNGYVRYKFKNFEDIVETKSSTQAYPFRKRVTYDPKVIDGYDLLLRDTLVIAQELNKN